MQAKSIINPVHLYILLYAHPPWGQHTTTSTNTHHGIASIRHQSPSEQ